MTDPRPLLIDCDPGVDDAVMLILAMLSPRVDVRAITTVAGNVPLRLTSRNARILRQLLSRGDIPVFAGCPAPLLRAPVTAEDFHGESGLQGIDIFEPDAPLADTHAVTFLVDTLSTAAPGEYTLVVTGPMTNIAAALALAPQIATGIGEMVVMAGADTEGGNITPFAEFNVYADPHAAAMVFQAQIPTTVLSLDVTHTVRAQLQRIDRISAINTPHAHIMANLLTAANMLEARWKPGLLAPMHDPSTIMWLLAPEIFTAKPAHVTVNTNMTSAAFGQTRLSLPSTERQGAPATWVTGADADAFFAHIETVLRAAK